MNDVTFCEVCEAMGLGGRTCTTAAKCHANEGLPPAFAKALPPAPAPTVVLRDTLCGHCGHVALPVMADGGWANCRWCEGN